MGPQALRAPRRRRRSLAPPRRLRLAGVPVKCHDGATRKVFVRVLGFSGDAPEHRLLAARRGHKDTAVDATVGSHAHLHNYNGKEPRCGRARRAWRCLGRVHVCVRACVCVHSAAGASNEFLAKYRALLAKYSHRYKGLKGVKAIEDAFRELDAMAFLHPFFLSCAAQRVMATPFLSQLLLFDRLHNVSAPALPELPSISGTRLAAAARLNTTSTLCPCARSWTWACTRRWCCTCWTRSQRKGGAGALRRLCTARCTASTCPTAPGVCCGSRGQARPTPALALCGCPSPSRSCAPCFPASA